MLTGSILFVDLTTWIVVDEQTAEYDPYLGADSVDLKVTCDPAGRALSLTSITTGPQIYLPLKDSSSNDATHFSEIPVFDLEASAIISSCFLPALKNDHTNHQMLIVLFSVENSETNSTSIKAAMYENSHDGCHESFFQTSCTPLFLNIPSTDILFMIPLYSVVGAFLIVTSEYACLFTLNDIVSATFNHEIVYLPDIPISFFQENYFFESEDNDKKYPEVQHIYFGTESNRIYQLNVSTLPKNKWDLTVSLFEEVPIAIGTSLVIFPCDESKKHLPHQSISESSAYMVYTGGMPASFSSVLCTKKGDQTKFERDQYLPWDLPIDAFRLDSQSSFSNKSYSEKRQELFLLSGLSSNTWKLSQIRCGIRLRTSSNPSNLPKNSIIFPFSVVLNSENHISIPSPPKPLHFFLSTSDFGSAFYSFEKNDNHKELNWIIDLENKTLALGSYEGMVIQVTTEGLSISNPTNPSVHMFVQMSPVKAHIYQNYVVTATISADQHQNEYEITVYKLDFSKYPSEDTLGIFLLTRIPINLLTSVTLVRLIPSNTDPSKPYTFVGIGSPENNVLRVFGLDSGETEQTYELGVKKVLGEKSFVNDIIKIPTLTSENEILLGLRNGTYHSIKWKTFPTNKMEMWLKSSYTIGSQEVTFMPSAEENANRIYISSDLMYKAEPPEYIPQLIIPDINNLDSPLSFCSFYDKDEGETIVSVFNNKLQYFKIDQTADVFARSFPLSSLPRQALYLDYLNSIVVLCTMSLDDRYSSTSPLLQIFDPITGEERIVKTMFKPKTNPVKGKLEKFNSIAEWVISVKKSDTTTAPSTPVDTTSTDEEVQYRFIVIGSDYGSEGRIRLFRLARSKSSRSFKLFESAVHHIDEPAVSLCQLDNNRILIGTTSKIITLSLEISNNRCRMIVSDLSISVSARKIHFQNNRLFVATNLGSVVIYELENNVFTKIQSEDRIRACLTQTVVDDNTVIVSDLNHMVTVLGSYSSETLIPNSDGVGQLENRLATGSLYKISEFRLPTLVKSIVPIDLIENPALKMLQTTTIKVTPKDEQLSLGTDFPLEDFQIQELKKTRNFAVVGVDGSIYILHLLSGSTFTKAEKKISELKQQDFEDLDFEEFDFEPEKKTAKTLQMYNTQKRQYNLNVIDGDNLLSTFPYEPWVKMLVTSLNNYY